jgi:hypothetical protein
MRMKCALKAGGFPLGMVLSGFVCLGNGCDSGGPSTVPRVVETPEQVRRRDRAIRDAVLEGAYGKRAQRAALKRLRRSGEHRTGGIDVPYRPAQEAR